MFELAPMPDEPGTFFRFLDRELKLRKVKYKTKFETDMLNDRLSYSFPGGGSIYIDICSCPAPDLHKERRDRWAWSGRVGECMNGVEKFQGMSHDALPRPIKIGGPKAGTLFGALVVDDSITPAEAALEDRLQNGRWKPKKTRRVDEHDRFRYAVYDIGEGNKVKLYKDCRVKITGEMSAAFEAVKAAERAYSDSLPTAPAPFPYQPRRRSKYKLRGIKPRPLFINM